MNTKIRFYMRGLGIGILVTALILIAVNLKNNKGQMTDAEIRERAAALGMVDGNSYSLTDAASAMNAEKEDAAETGEPQTDELKEVNPEEGTASGEKTEEEAGSETEAEETKTEETEAEEVKAEETKPEETEAEEVKPDETKVEEAGLEETKAEETKPEETKSEETKPEETKTEEPAAQETKPAEGSKVTISIARGAASETAAATLAGAGLIEDAADFNSYMIRNGYDRRIHPGTFEILMGSSYEEICKIIAG
ncbi:MAG: hypothetical protein IKQ28_04835 [Lachnospiraceae bacterium]|nr:hypothetical protein [Lachnospiraceae bacterium]MBR6302754.1 hypothetical protein [Lachnospiraceae bacterium]